MAAPIETYIQLPSDTGNTGKKVRAQSRVVGSNTVYSHQFVNVTNVSQRGVYIDLESGIEVVDTTGTMWIIYGYLYENNYLRYFVQDINGRNALLPSSALSKRDHLATYRAIQRRINRLEAQIGALDVEDYGIKYFEENTIDPIDYGARYRKIEKKLQALKALETDGSYESGTKYFEESGPTTDALKSKLKSVQRKLALLN